MVKSFQGVRQVKATKNEMQPATVADYMTTRLVTFHPEQTMDQVIHILIEKNISGGPVIDDDQNLVGIISEGDCLKEVVRGKYTNTPNLSGRVRERMAVNVQTINPEINIFEAAQMFLNLRLRRFPVVKDGKLLGQISQKDVMCAFHKLKEATWCK